MLAVQKRFNSYMESYYKDIQELATIGLEQTKVDPKNLVILIVEVDFHQDFVNILAPNFDWSPIRARGETPYARVMCSMDVLRIYMNEKKWLNTDLIAFFGLEPPIGLISGAYLGDGFVLFQIGGENHVGN